MKSEHLLVLLQNCTAARSFVLFFSFLRSHCEKIGSAGFISCTGEKSQRKHLAVRAPAQGHEPTAATAAATTAATATAVAAEGAHLEGDTGVSVGDVAAARQQLQGGVTELGARAGERTLR